MVLDDKGQEVRGGLALMPEVEKLFEFEFTVPAGWHVTSVTGADETPLTFERYGAVDQPARIRVRLPEGMRAGPGVYGQFPRRQFAGGLAGRLAIVPGGVSRVRGGGRRRQRGAVAVEARDDMTVRPDSLRQLTPLDETEKAQYGLADVATNLAYRYESPDYAATLRVQRTQPRLTARTFSFLASSPTD